MPARLPYDEATAYAPNWRDAMIGALKKGARNLTGGKAFPDQEQRMLDEDAESVIPEVSGPAKKQQLTNALMGFGPGNIGGALAGTLRVGGNPRLQITHALSDPTQLGRAGTPLKELSSPSFAIRDVQQKIPFVYPNEQSAVVVPRVGALEPGNHPGTIFNRDAYVRRGADMAKELNNASGRLGQRFFSGDARLTEGFTPSSVSQTTAIDMSPKFNSFADFEASRAGAGALERAKGKSPTQWGGQFETAMLDWLDTQPNLKNQMRADTLLGPPPGYWSQALRTSAGEGNPMARDLIRSAREAPSAYAELKTLGPLALTPEKIAGVVLPKMSLSDNGRMAAMVEALKREYAQRKLPVAEYEPGATRADMSGLFDQLQTAAGPYGGR